MKFANLYSSVGESKQGMENEIRYYLIWHGQGSYTFTECYTKYFVKWRYSIQTRNHGSDVFDSGSVWLPHY